MTDRSGMVLFGLGTWKTRGLRKRQKADKSPMKRERYSFTAEKNGNAKMGTQLLNSKRLKHK
jgi:hypothetical protein